MDKTEWIYINNTDNSARYALGTKGNRTLFCFGINPSKATPDEPDPTLKKVEQIAKHNGYDSFVMFNVYPKRDTDFNDLGKVISDTEHSKNIEVILKTIPKDHTIDIWVAFGNHIFDRTYLPFCLKDIYNQLPKNNIHWYATKTNKSGAPAHPLYQRNTAMLLDFNMDSFMESLEKNCGI